MTYDLLYANGCSFTNHEPLTQNEKWPLNLASHLGIPDYINDGEGSGTNQGIFKRTAKFLSETTVPHKNILAVIQLTYPFRFEMPSKRVHPAKWQNYITAGHPNDVAQDRNRHYYNARLKAFAEHPNYVSWEFYIQASAINNLLRARGVTSYFLCLETPQTQEDFEDSYIPWMYDNPTDSDMNRMVQNIGMPKPSYAISKSDGHFNSEANRKLSKHMAKQINIKEQS